MKSKLILLSIALFFLNHFAAFAQGMGDYLILQDIGVYKISKPEKPIRGFAPIGGPRIYDSAGAVGGSGHFPDHVDKTYEVTYYGGDSNVLPTVQVTQHSSSDSDKWLLHEVDAPFRNYGRPGGSYILDTIDGNTIITSFIGGGEYQWLSGNKVIHIEYHDLRMEKPKPLDIVRAYLAKHPSSLEQINSKELRSEARSSKWIKDEMERLLWLCDKWFMQVQLGKTEIKPSLQKVAGHLKSFLDYREKYFKISSSSESI